MNGTSKTIFPQRLEVPAWLRRHGIFPTRQRVQVAEALLCEPQHLTADQLLQRVNAEHPSVSRATVYNTLGAFVRAGLVRVVSVDGGTVCYDSSTHHHAHVFYEDSGRVVDAEVDLLKLAERVPLPDDIEITDVDFVVRVRSKPSETS